MLLKYKTYTNLFYSSDFNIFIQSTFPPFFFSFWLFGIRIISLFNQAPLDYTVCAVSGSSLLLSAAL